MTILRLQLFDRTRDQAQSVDADMIKSMDGAAAAIGAAYRFDPLLVISEICSDF